MVDLPTSWMPATGTHSVPEGHGLLTGSQSSVQTPPLARRTHRSDSQPAGPSQEAPNRARGGRGSVSRNDADPVGLPRSWEPGESPSLSFARPSQAIVAKSETAANQYSTCRGSIDASGSARRGPTREAYRATGVQVLVQCSRWLTRLPGRISRTATELWVSSAAVAAPVHNKPTSAFSRSGGVQPAVPEPRPGTLARRHPDRCTGRRPRARDRSRARAAPVPRGPGAAYCGGRGRGPH